MNIEFYKETNFKNTEIGKIPEDWEVVRLKDICTINPEQIDPRIQMPNRTFLYIDISSVEEGKIKEHKEILGRNAPVRARRVIRKNDVIMSTVRPYLKAFALVPEQYDGQICSTGFAVLRCNNKNKINHCYLLYALLSDKTIDQCKAMMVGGQYPALNQSQVENLKIPLPTLPEQKAIAQILSTVDEAIQKVNETIAKAERLKKGLMQELLTGRVRIREESGGIVFYRETKFKDTEIGRIPTEWEVARLGELTKVTVGYVGKIDEYYTTKNDGVPLLSTTNISENGIRLDEIKYVSREFHSKNKKSQVFPGDIIIARHGMSGTAATIPEFLKEAQCLNVVIVRSSQKFYSKFVEYLFNFEPTRRRLLGWKSGSVQGVVNTKVLERFKILLPPLSEQKAIVQILSTVDKLIEVRKKQKEKLKRVKKGLMNILLTGRVRVVMNGERPR